MRRTPGLELGAPLDKAVDGMTVTTSRRGGRGVVHHIYTDHFASNISSGGSKNGGGHERTKPGESVAGSIRQKKITPAFYENLHVGTAPRCVSRSVAHFFLYFFSVKLLTLQNGHTYQ